MTKREQAQELFHEGYNCCQAVMAAYAQELGLSKDQAARLGSSFGGGVARLREVCGAVNAMALAAALHCGYESPTDQEGKAAHYELVQGMASRFKEENGSYICRELLEANPEPPLAPGEPQGGHNPACGKFVGDAAAILEELFQRKP